ncbi:hypothetical protein B0H67DRAFT_548076 [Lasiosphaeris hirsuta]|uniref:Putative zinc-finger domain-containing protein n=1 Tax=Lasiosphaeris hirsuta TaxID=260670 RepID=A0AA40E9H3_9PEZI|nr:hypothetical protein B0H67DRAFT_548076 [Lasiosphaeris hirsuta]
MSQHQYQYGYGQYPGQPPQPQPPHQHPPQMYGFHPPPAYPPPSYNLPYDPAAAERNRDISQNSFDYNVCHIPGLGIAGAQTPGLPYSGAPGTGGWAQQPSFAAALPGIQQPISPIAYSTPQPQSRPRNSDQTRSAKLPTKPPPPAAPRSQPVPNIDVEEGELSEGQFEDLYEPREPAQASSAAQDSAKLPMPAGPSRPTSDVDTPIDTPEAGFYGNGEGEDEGESPAGKPPNLEYFNATARERSGSYSPFLSPREIENTTLQVLQVNPSSPFLTTGLAINPNAASQPRTNQKNGDGASMAIHNSLNNAQSDPSVPPTLHQVRKEAQKAILRLWGVGVKFQDYIDEGFDEKIIRRLFEDLNLSISKSVSGSKLLTQDSELRQGISDTQLQTQPVPSTKDSTSASGPSGSGEERKDRIARLLAAKAAKGPATPATGPTPSQAKLDTTSLPQQSQTIAPMALPKQRTWGEKERLIQQKIAALQKSREVQAQKLANENIDSGPAHIGDTIMAGTQVIPSSVSDTEMTLLGQTQGSSEDSTKKVGSIPGLALPSALKPSQTSNQRKRPVAADFVDYSTTVGSPKRPFGLDRKEASLIIDVSDGSDDEEMDMDMESPAEDPSSTHRGGSFSQRGPSIRDFPPLSNPFPQRKFSSPVPISQTPPAGSANIRRRETELDLKEKEIQDMRRKIAEAEAKRKVKKSSVGSQTPNQSGGTPELKDTELARLPPKQRPISADLSDGPSAQLLSEATSAKLPKPSRRPSSAQLGRAERRGRIVNLGLSRIDESLEQKMNRLKQLKEEEVKLRLEIERGLAEKKMLKEQLGKFESNPSEDGEQYGGPSLGGSSAESASQAGSAHASPQVIPISRTPSGVSEPGDEASDVSMDEDDSSPEPSRRPTPSQEPSQHDSSATYEKASADIVRTQASDNLGDDLEKDSSVETSAPRSGLQGTEASQPKDHIDSQPQTGVVAITDTHHSDAALDEDIVIAPVEYVDLATGEDTAPMELDSVPASPIHVDPPVGHSGTDEDSHTGRQTSMALLDQISSVTQPREDVQEIEIGAAKETVNATAQQSELGFVPYKSPLRYFHAYRFHSDYQDSIAGGLKSLTYSNRIDPKSPFCPYELDGQQCPGNCEFQHFKSIGAPDDQILLELGKADEYSGEQKSRFIQGLRELLQNFRVNKVKDFDTIARGIIEFRARFLGDSSKILHLEGVTL